MTDGSRSINSEPQETFDVKPDERRKPSDVCGQQRDESHTGTHTAVASRRREGFCACAPVWARFGIGRIERRRPGARSAGRARSAKRTNSARLATFAGFARPVGRGKSAGCARRAGRRHRAVARSRKPRRGQSAAAGRERPAGCRATCPPPRTRSACSSNRPPQAHGLPFEFFARLIWQESRFKPNAVGPMTRSGRGRRESPSSCPRRRASAACSIRSIRSRHYLNQRNFSRSCTPSSAISGWPRRPIMPARADCATGSKAAAALPAETRQLRHDHHRAQCRRLGGGEPRRRRQRPPAAHLVRGIDGAVEGRAVALYRRA